ncbi:c-type cytochrome [Thiomicrorhabdus sp. Milos-T2]|uniref:c-type cytochrome n=1 Tax=Thiomicrorhabdus sp. Milos-T2 TaxID=90814 RepID=UPI000AEAFED3|nr:c-type cytochrome [Thiomicrorhabdus sp. Milos-T2]
MKKRFNFKTTAVITTAILGSTLLLAGCSGDNDDTTAAKAPAAEQNTMAVKQPAPVEAPKAALQPAPAPKAMEEAKAVVEEKVAEVKEAAAEVVAAAPSGEKLYATCVGCHGSKAEGGVGPRLSNQKPEDIVAKLTKYKAGEQMGPMTGMMAPMAAGLSTADMEAISKYVTTL